jgi:hypothetical protein
LNSAPKRRRRASAAASSISALTLFGTTPPAISAFDRKDVRSLSRDLDAMKVRCPGGLDEAHSDHRGGKRAGGKPARMTMPAGSIFHEAVQDGGEKIEPSPVSA